MKKQNHTAKTNKSRQSGFSPLLLILIIVIVLALALTGWFIWQRNQQDTDNSFDSSPQSQNSQDEQQDDPPEDKKTFVCKDAFSISFPNSLESTITDAGQCLISNISVNEMPPMGPLPPDQLGLFFNIQTTQITTSSDYLEDYLERSQDDFPLELKSQTEIILDNGNIATLATLYGGHPTPHNFYFFVYIKDNQAITTSYPLDSNHKELALEILKSIR